jgi:NAD(P)-dependent dehydrogenase (short-subunit alcohol dehydrogenase family)
MTAVITGGSSGIGAAMVTQFSAAGYQVAFTGTRSLESVPETLSALPNSLYVQGDAGSREDIQRLRDEVRGRFGEDLGQLYVIANAGIDAADTETEKVEKLRRTNVDGPGYLLDAFAPDLSKNADSLFVGVGSIVGTMGVVLPGNKEYQASKVAVETLVRGAADLYPDVNAITLSPGFIRTPMTQGSVVYGIITRLAAMAAVSDADLRAILANYMGGDDKLGSTAAEIFVNLIGQPLTGHAIYKTVSKVFQRDPALAGQTPLMMAIKAAQDSAINARMDEVLSATDILITADVVAQTLMEEVRERRTPRGGVLQAYQSGSRAVPPIARLLAPLRTA